MDVSENIDPVSPEIDFTNTEKSNKILDIKIEKPFILEPDV